MGTMYRVYRYNHPTELVFFTYAEAYNAGLRRYGAAYEFSIVTVRKTA